MPAERSRALAFALALVPSAAGAHPAAASRFDYERHVRPLFVKHCAPCHQPSGIAPMSLLRYEDAAPWANGIKLQVLEGRMPPFLPAEGIGWWRRARGLGAREVDLVVEWASGGAPRGEGPDGAAGEAPAPGVDPDLAVDSPREIVLAADEWERAECLVFRPGLTRRRTLAAVGLLPGNASIVRGAVLYPGDACLEDGRPLATWLPGAAWFELPREAGELLRPGGAIAARILYRKTWRLDGREARDRTRLLLRFAEGPPAALLQVRVAPGAGVTLAGPASILSVFPAGPRGSSLRLEAERPGRTAEPLIRFENFDPDWRERYVPERLLELPAGTRLQATGGAFWLDYRSGRGASPARAGR